MAARGESLFPTLCFLLLLTLVGLSGYQLCGKEFSVHPGFLEKLSA